MSVAEAESSDIAARASPRAAFDPDGIAMTRPPPCRAGSPGGRAASGPTDGADGADGADEADGSEDTTRAASAGETPALVSRRMASSRAMSPGEYRRWAPEVCTLGPSPYRRSQVRSVAGATHQRLGRQQQRVARWTPRSAAPSG
jgi:hypothetical protein